MALFFDIMFRRLMSSQVVLMVKISPVSVGEVGSIPGLGKSPGRWGDPLEESMEIHPSILSGKIPRAEKPEATVSGVTKRQSDGATGPQHTSCWTNRKAADSCMLIFYYVTC